MAFRNLSSTLLVGIKKGDPMDRLLIQLIVS